MRIVVLFHLQKQIINNKTVYLLSRQEDYYPTALIPMAIVPFKVFRMASYKILEGFLWLNGLLLAYLTVPVVLLISQIFDGFKRPTRLAISKDE